jgi:hypothetical protein
MARPDLVQWCRRLGDGAVRVLKLLAGTRSRRADRLATHRPTQAAVTGSIQSVRATVVHVRYPAIATCAPVEGWRFICDNMRRRYRTVKH